MAQEKRSALAPLGPSATRNIAWDQRVIFSDRLTVPAAK